MPIHHILPLSEKIPLCLAPQIINHSPDTVFRRIILYKILMGSQQTFEHESGFYNIGSIILTAERNGLTGFTVHPMCPHAVIAVGILVAQETNNLQYTFSTLFTGDKPAFYADNDSHHSESRPTNGSCLGTTVTPFMRQSGFRMGKIPKVTESLLLNEGHKFVVRKPLLLFLSRNQIKRV